MKCDHDSTFGYALEVDQTANLFDAMRHNHSQGRNNVIEVCGEGGLCKSSCASGLLCVLDPTFKTDGFSRVAWDTQQALAMIPNIKREQGFQIDERPTDTGVGSGRRRSDLSLVIETAREPRNDLIVCSILPEIPELAHWSLEAMLVHDNHGYFALRDYSRDYVGYVRLPRVGELAGEKWWNAYLARKREFNETIRQQRMGGSYFDVQALEVLRHPNAAALVEKKLTKSTALNLVNDAKPRLNMNNEARAIADRLVYWAKTGEIACKMAESQNPKRKG